MPVRTTPIDGSFQAMSPLVGPVLEASKPESTDGRRECWANWDEGACRGESLGSIGPMCPRRGFSVAAPDLESGLWRLGIA